MTIQDFTPHVLDLTLYRGDTVNIPLRLGSGTTVNGVTTFDQGYDLTGVQWSAQVREKTAAEDADPVAVFDIILEDQTVLETRGRFRVTMSEADAAVLPLTLKLAWDLQAKWPGGPVKTYFAGSVAVKKDWTR